VHKETGLIEQIELSRQGFFGITAVVVEDKDSVGSHIEEGKVDEVVAQNLVDLLA